LFSAEIISAPPYLDLPFLVVFALQKVSVQDSGLFVFFQMKEMRKKEKETRCEGEEHQSMCYFISDNYSRGWEEKGVGRGSGEDRGKGECQRLLVV